MNKIKKLFYIFILTFLLSTLFGCQSAKERDGLTIINVGLQNFYVNVAQTADDRTKGLMHKPNLGKGIGMLIVFDEESVKNSIWMKNMYFPIDLVWISEKKEVVGYETISPCRQVQCSSYHPNIPAKYALEINAGEFKGKKGDYVEFTLPSVKR